MLKKPIYFKRHFLLLKLVCVRVCVCLWYASAGVWSVPAGQIAQGDVPLGSYQGASH